ncbi:MAG: FAD-binding oxidoreductase, partial [Litorivicinus sp.]
MTLPAANAILITDFLNALRDAGFRGECHQDKAHRLVMSTDNSVYQVEPQAVVYPGVESDLRVLMRVANESRFMGIQFAPRGGGTGTNGQSLNHCVTVDTSRHLNKIIDIDLDTNTVWVQPGVVLDQLNQALAAHGLFFPPNVSTSSRATIGGMVGTDASGKGSRLYGKTSDYVESMQIVLSDASVLMTRTMQGMSERAAGAVEQLKSSVSSNLDEIERRFPKMNRGLTGYNLKQAWDGETVNLNYLFAGSEGSLGLTQRIKLRVVPLPKVVKLVSLGYDDFMLALRDVQTLAPFNAESVEILDDKIMSLAKSDTSWHQIADVFGGDDLAAVNFVEFVGADEASVDAQVNALIDALDARKGQPGAPVSWTMARDEAQRKALWNIRKKAVGLLGALQGKRRALPFVEDTAVPPEVLADFVAEFRAVLDEQGVAYGMFGHADVGCLHVRPTLD